VSHTQTRTFNRVERNASGSDLLEADDRNLAPRLTPASVHVEIHVTCNKQSTYTIGLNYVEPRPSTGGGRCVWLLTLILRNFRNTLFRFDISL
jgi:hypothetical protein